MPISDGTLYSFKYVNGHPQNSASGLLTVVAFGILVEISTGYTLLAVGEGVQLHAGLGGLNPFDLGHPFQHIGELSDAGSMNFG